jgi:hypothetical protein
MITEMTTQAQADLYDRAADYIEAHGWTTNELESDTGEVCISGAIGIAFDPNLVRRFGHEPDDLNRWIRKYAQWTALTGDLAQHVPADNIITWTDVITWNNEKADKAAVIDVLRAAAKELRA